MPTWKATVLPILLASLAQAGSTLVNGGFEQGLEGWVVWGATPGAVVHQGKGSCRVHLDTAGWAGASQTMEIPAGMAQVRVSGWMRSDTIKSGKENWERGRLSVEFFGLKGDTLGGYPPAVGQVRGKMPWTLMDRTYPVPTGTATLKLGCALGNSSGTLYCDDLSVQFLP